METLKNKTKKPHQVCGHAQTESCPSRSEVVQNRVCCHLFEIVRSERTAPWKPPNLKCFIFFLPSFKDLNLFQSFCLECFLGVERFWHRFPFSEQYCQLDVKKTRQKKNNRKYGLSDGIKHQANKTISSQGAVRSRATHFNYSYIWMK